MRSGAIRSAPWGRIICISAGMVGTIGLGRSIEYTMEKDGKDNLIPLNERTKEEQRAITSQGGIASGKARRRKKLLRECLEELLERETVGENGEKMSGAEAVSVKLFQQALAGDLKAFEIVRDTAGQKPIEKVQMKTDVNIADSADRLNGIFSDIKNGQD